MTTKTTKTDHGEALAKLVETAKTTRLSPEQEAAALVKASLAGGKAGIIAALDAAVGLPWIIGVDAIVEAWPALKAPSRKNLLAALVAQQTEQARRFRLSLGRGMFVPDPETALKLIHVVSAEMATGENGALTQNDRQNFFNVLIGKDKPWLLRLPVADLKAEESGAIFRCAVAACFSRQCPPLTQLFLIRWIASSGNLVKLPDDLLESIAKSVKRWHPKLQDQLKADVPEIPPVIGEALKKSPAPQQQQQPRQDRQESQQQPKEHAQPKPEQARPERKQQQQQSQPAPRHSAAGFDLVSTLRQIESHVRSLQSELSTAKNELRERRPAGRDRQRDKKPVEILDPSNASIEELQRHNLQLEETVKELRGQLEELAADHEDIATSMKAHDETPIADGREQLKALLGIKLKEHFDDYTELAKEPPDEVLREHYRLLLEDVFDVLQKQGIVFAT